VSQADETPEPQPEPEPEPEVQEDAPAEEPEAVEPDTQASQDIVVPMHAEEV
jgi:hypothetical protein